MTMYLLLRNNKQSGPYSLEDLKNMGLKAYDLVWLEGKSAAWRYPCEIEELKEFAPAVEEQPFDRFYKKPVATTTTTTASSPNGNKDTSTIAFQPVSSTSSSREPAVLTGKRIIYVTLPAGRPASTPVRETPVREIPRELPTLGENTSLSDRREMSTVEFAPRRRAHSNERLMKLLGVGLCILALLAAGIFIGLSMNKQTLASQKRIASGTTSPSTAKQVSAAVRPAPVLTTNNAAPVSSTADENARSANDVTVTTSAPGKRTRKHSGKVIIPALIPPIQKDSPLAEIPVVTREAIHRKTAEPSLIDNNEAAKTALTSEVSVGANGYSVGTFGGINDLQLTVTNRSTHPLDLVVVEVKYIQANKKVYKTENLNFHDVGAGGALMQEAPKSSRGIRVQYRIISISSKEMGISYSGL